MMRGLDRDDGRIRIFGRDATRDFTYVDDVVRVLLDAQQATGHVINIGTGQETPIVELAKRILLLFDMPDSRMSFEEPRAWDRVVRRYAAVDRLRELFGWVPATPLPDGLRRAAQWLHAAGYVGRRPG
jgi:nucleoside-diphosphate-sugar epimerase